MMDIKKLSQNYLHEVISLRRQLHRQPETGFKETATARLVTEKLNSFGIETQRIRKTGVIGTINGHADGPTIGLRADMDALEIDEKTGADFASLNKGIMHACGHDAHTAMLVYAAAVLNTVRSQLRGTVKLFFQPAEELDRGALTFIHDGACDALNAAFAIHVTPDIPAGLVSIEPGAIMAGCDFFKIHLLGKGGHGAVPHQGVDTVVAASALVMNLQSLVSREYDTEEPLVVTVGCLHAGTRFNILAEEARLSGSVRTFNRKVSKRIPESIERIVTATAQTYRVEPNIEYKRGCPVMTNDPSLTQTARKAAGIIMGERSIVHMPRSMVGEDFAYFSEKCPSVLAWLGAGYTDRPNHPLHNPRFDLNEEALWRGVALHAQMACEFLKGEK